MRKAHVARGQKIVNKGSGAAGFLCDGKSTTCVGAAVGANASQGITYVAAGALYAQMPALSRRGALRTIQGAVFRLLGQNLSRQALRFTASDRGLGQLSEEEEPRGKK